MFGGVGKIKCLMFLTCKRILMLLMLMMLASLFLMRRMLNVDRTPLPCMIGQGFPEDRTGGGTGKA